MSPASADAGRHTAMQHAHPRIKAELLPGTAYPGSDSQATREAGDIAGDQNAPRHQPIL
jgi:hypothetical protein